MSDESKSNGNGKRSKGKWRVRFFLIILVLILIWLAMRKFGIKMTYRTDDTEIIDPYRD